MFIALIVLAAMLLLAWLVAPFWSRPAASKAVISPANETRRQLRDLDFDLATGKIEEGDYAQMKAAAQRKLETVAAARPATKPARAEYSRVQQNSALAEAEIAISRARLRLQSATRAEARSGEESSAPVDPAA